MIEFKKEFVVGIRKISTQKELDGIFINELDEKALIESGYIGIKEEKKDKKKTEEKKK